MNPNGLIQADQALYGQLQAQDEQSRRIALDVVLRSGMVGSIDDMISAAEKVRAYLGDGTIPVKTAP